MLYKFDILFKKKVMDGALRAVTYSHLLRQPDALGQGETLEGAVGTLSLPDSEKENDSSISTLFERYRTQLVGYYWSEVFGKDFPLRFSFNDPDDVTSLRAELCDETGFHHPSDVETFPVDGTKTLDLKDADSFVALVPKTGDCVVSDGETDISLQAGQLMLIPATVKEVTIQGRTDIKSIKPVSRNFNSQIL